MPLTAKVNGKSVVAPLLSDDEWQTLKECVRTGMGHIEMPCCGAAGHPRMSRLGTKHFAHNPRKHDASHSSSHCTSSYESYEHLKIKEELVKICDSYGWQVATEYRYEDWIADILAYKPGRKIVFEVQLSDLPVEEFRQRSAKYERDGIECYWLLSKPLSASLFEFGITFAESGGISVLCEGKSVSLRDFVGGILSNTVRFCSTIRGYAKPVCGTIYVWTVSCKKCWKVSHFYYGDIIACLHSDCGLDRQILCADNQSENVVLKHPTTNGVVIKLLRKKYPDANPILARIHTIKTLDYDIISFIYLCPYCGEVLGGLSYLGDRFYPVLDNGNLLETMEINDFQHWPIPDSKPKYKSLSCLHWCIPSDGNPCDTVDCRYGDRPRQKRLSDFLF